MPANDAAEVPLQILAGVRVVELGMWVAAPAAAAMLADWGADVVKVEQPSGDPNRYTLRHLGHDADAEPPFELDNRDKRSVVLDLREPAGQDALDRLLGWADVFLTNLRPGALERLGLDPGSLRSRHRRLIIGTLTGYGWAGPERDRAGYDVSAFWARTGIAAMLNPAGQPPPGIRPGMGDRMAAANLVAGVLAALLHRERAGDGAVVDVSLLRSGIYAAGNDVALQLYFGRRGRARPAASGMSLRCTTAIRRPTGAGSGWSRWKAAGTGPDWCGHWTGKTWRPTSGSPLGEPGG